MAWPPAYGLVIGGPTASGKSALAIAVAKELDAEIVSADSVQVYRGMDIGTAKVDLSTSQIPHHCIDIVDPGVPFSVAIYQSMARDAVSDIDDRGHLPIISGGTGFYIRSIIDDYDFAPGEQADNPIREKYMELNERMGPDRVWEELRSIDPQSAKIIHPNNTKRVIRALEMAEMGLSYSEQVDRLASIEQVMPCTFIAIDVERQSLYDRIDERVDQMREAGLIDEVKRLLDSGFREAITAPQAIGYKEIVEALDGISTIDEAFEKIKRSSRRYAKRQLSWLRGDDRVIWIDGTDADLDRMAAETLEHLEHGRGKWNSDSTS